MVIKFSCQHCKKPLKVPDRLAGREGPCPVCKKKLIVPSITSASPPPAAKQSANASQSDQGVVSNIEIEDIAAAALADEPEEETPIAGDVTFACDFCGEDITMSVELAGKRAPCPECRRIVRVPEPVSKKPKDWRKAEQNLPTGAALAQQQEAPEGTWTTGGARKVSTQALEEAGALPEEKPPVTTLTWIKRGAFATAGLVVLVLGVMFLVDWFSAGRQASAVDEALAAVSPEEQEKHELGADQVAAAHLAVAKYFLDSDEHGRIKAEGGDTKGAWNQFLLARNYALGQVGGMKAKPPRVREAPLFLIEVAEAQLAMGGSDAEVAEGRRLGWTEAMNAATQSLSSIAAEASPFHREVKREGVRRVARRLIASGQATLAPVVAAGAIPQEDLNAAAAGNDPLQKAPSNDGLRAMAVVGLEMVRAGNEDGAKVLLDQILETIPRAPDNRPAAVPVILPPLSVEVAALCVAFDRLKDVPVNRASESDADALRGGEAIAKALGKTSVGDAIAQARGIGSTVARAEALVGIADASEDVGAIEAATGAIRAIESDGEKGKNDAIRNALAFRLARIAVNAKADENVLKGIAGAAISPSVRAWVQLEVVRKRLATAEDEESLSTVDGEMSNKSFLAYDVALVELAAQVQSKGGDVMDLIDGLDAKQKPLGRAGRVLGMVMK